MQSFLSVGDQVTFSKTVGETDVYLFAGITGDFAPNHIDEAFMRKTAFGQFTTLPIAILGAVFSGVAAARRSNIAVAGLIISILVIGVALVRLTIGGGIF